MFVHNKQQPERGYDPRKRIVFTRKDSLQMMLEVLLVVEDDEPRGVIISGPDVVSGEEIHLNLRETLSLAQRFLPGLENPLTRLACPFHVLSTTDGSNYVTKLSRQTEIGEQKFVLHGGHKGDLGIKLLDWYQTFKNFRLQDFNTDLLLVPTHMNRLSDTLTRVR